MSTAAITIAHRDELERTGNWSLVRRTLGVSSFGINIVDIPPGEGIPEHDETSRDPEELFVNTFYFRYVQPGDAAPR